MNHFLLWADISPVQEGHYYKLECNALPKLLKYDLKHKYRKPEKANCASTVTEFLANSCSWIVYYNVLCGTSLSTISTVETPLMAMSWQLPLFLVPADGPCIQSYFDLSTTATSPQWQQLLKLVQTAKIASQQEPVNQQLTNSVYKTLFLITHYQLTSISLWRWRILLTTSSICRGYFLRFPAVSLIKSSKSEHIARTCASLSLFKGSISENCWLKY